MPSDFSTESEAALDHLERELAAIRTGRANPALVEEISIEAYGVATPLVQLAAISAPEPRMIVVQPWDPSVIKDIEKGLTQSSLGITPVVDGKTIRLPFPAMTEERRTQMVKLVNEKAEETRVRIRGIREHLMKDLKQAQKDGSLSEDVVTQKTKQLQNDVDAALEQVASAIERKQEELTTI